MLRDGLRRVTRAIGHVLYRTACRMLRRTATDWHNRRWSNCELRQVAPFLTGATLNVSGWRDEDREGGHYADYFVGKTSYRISNIAGAKGLTGAEGEIELDLEDPVPDSLRGRFDVVFNHTTLEHVYDIHAAVRALCDLSRDSVVVVVPFSQPTHWEEGSFSDYWRPTAFALRQMFEDNDFEVVYLTHNLNPVFPIYLFAVAVRDREAWIARGGPTAFEVPRNYVP